MSLREGGIEWASLIEGTILFSGLKYQLKGKSPYNLANILNLWDLTGHKIDPTRHLWDPSCDL